MEAAASSSSSVSALLRRRLRATVRCCFGNGGGGGGGGLGERMRWRRRAGAGELRYDALSYALNFDEGDLLDADGQSEDRRGDRFLCRSFSSQLARAAAVEVA